MTGKALVAFGGIIFVFVSSSVNAFTSLITSITILLNIGLDVLKKFDFALVFVDVFVLRITKDRAYTVIIASSYNHVMSQANICFDSGLNVLQIFSIDIENDRLPLLVNVGAYEQEVMRKDWMFKLVGAEQFSIGKAQCCITIDAAEGFMYQYSLEVNGKTLEKFTENQSKIMKTWLCNVSGMPFRIVLGMTASLLCITNCFNIS